MNKSSATRLRKMTASVNDFFFFPSGAIFLWRDGMILPVIALYFPD
jgi:hypothetical protein